MRLPSPFQGNSHDHSPVSVESSTTAHIDYSSTISFADKKRPTREQAEEAVRTLLRWAGDNPDREGLKKTPQRVTQSFEEFFSGYKTDPKAFLIQALEECPNHQEVAGYEELVLLRNIRFESYCEHHLVPIIGTAHVAYLPKKRVVGISKLARVVDLFAKRLQIQEKMTMEIAEAIDEALNPLGVAVVIEASHQCMTTRGVHKTGVTMVTNHMTGSFRTDMTRRRDFFSMTGNPASQESNYS